MLNNIQVVAFDVNGTLVGGNFRLWNTIFDEDLRLKKREGAQPLRWYDAQTGKITFEEMVSQTYEVENPVKMKKAAFEVYLSELELREGCISLLESLNGKYEMIICSDTSGVTKVITKAFDIEKYFAKSFYSIDVGYMKSDIEFWNHVLASVQRKPEKLVMVGDNVRCDIHWPNIMGMTTIQIPTTEKLPSRDLEVQCEDDKADYHINTLLDILDILSKIG